MDASQLKQSAQKHHSDSLYSKLPLDLFYHRCTNVALTDQKQPTWLCKTSSEARMAADWWEIGGDYSNARLQKSRVFRNWWKTVRNCSAVHMVHWFLAESASTIFHCLHTEKLTEKSLHNWPCERHFRHRKTNDCGMNKTIYYHIICNISTGANFISCVLDCHTQSKIQTHYKQHNRSCIFQTSRNMHHRKCSRWRENSLGWKSDGMQSGHQVVGVTRWPSDLHHVH